MIAALSGAVTPAVGLFIVLLLIDNSFGVIRALIASVQTHRGLKVDVKTFDWSYVANFAKSQLMAPPTLVVAGALWLAAQTPGATKETILAAATAAATAQCLVLGRDIIGKIRGTATVLAVQSKA